MMCKFNPYAWFDLFPIKKWLEIHAIRMQIILNSFQCINYIQIEVNVE